MTSSHACFDSLHPENPVKAFDSLSQTGNPFFAYRLPGDDSVSLGSGTIITVDDYDGTTSGFAIAPFDPSETAKIILPRIVFQTPQIHPSQIPHISVECPTSPSESYIEAIENLTRILRRRGGKTVIARTIDADAEIESIAVMFHALCCSYPDSYVYCWTTDGNRFWIGAVPEVLLHVAGNRLESMALAGTMEATSDAPWDVKNIEEQQLVTDFIASAFADFGLSPAVQSPQDKFAGPVKHLCTYISAATPSKDFDILDFARRLSPTPAVSGFPRGEALKEIRMIETEPREYYGGYSGPITNRRQGFFFVTLRCMAIDKAARKIRLYAGGGITALSNPEQEWKETCLKASTLLAIFK